MKVYVDESPAGSGKTTRILKDIANRDGKFLFIVERIERFSEVAAQIRTLSSGRDRFPEIVTISSRDERKGSVSRKIEDLPIDHLDTQHVIVLATHAALLSSDFSDFTDWEIIVDEVPSFLDFEQKCTHLDAAFFQKFYQLKALNENWSTVEPTQAGATLTVSEIRSDESHAHLATFHRRVLEANRIGSKRSVFCNLADWDAMEDYAQQWCWASIFSLLELVAFQKVTLLGNRFRADVGSQLSLANDEGSVNWVQLTTLAGVRVFQQRKVHIRYFSDDRPASRSLFESEAGQKMLLEIGEYLAHYLAGTDHIWTANDPVQAGGAFSGTLSARTQLEAGGLQKASYLSPRQAGTNAHQHCTHAAGIYSAKPSSNLINLLNHFDISSDAWTQSVEHEAILQFVTRTSVRSADNSSPVHLWVFDRRQAEYLEGYFNELAHVDVDVALVDLGPEIPKKEARGPKAMVRTPEQEEAYQAGRRAKDAERKRKKRAESKCIEI